MTPSSPSRRRKAFIAGLIGNVMEWYDFALYGFFASIIGQQFFPSENHVTSLLATFGVFATGFIARPIGAAFFGHLGDRKGRVVVLRLSVILMGASTFLFGLLPTYAMIGVAAPVLLTLLRILQGFSVGGEFTGSLIFLIERDHGNRRGLIGALSFISAMLGILLGSATGALVNAILTPEQVSAWGWRSPFLFGIVITLLAGNFRYSLVDDAAKDAPKPLPLIMAFKRDWPAILRIIGLFLLGGMGFYMIFIYATTYLSVQVGLTPAMSMEINTTSMAFLMFSVAFFGWLSDKIGRKPVLWFGSIGCMLFAGPLFHAMHHMEPLIVFLGQIGFAVLIGAALGPSTAVMVEVTKAAYRCTSISIAYNLTISLFGGTTPIIATWLIAKTGNPITPGYYLAVAAVVTVITICFIPETNHVEIERRFD